MTRAAAIIALASGAALVVLGIAMPRTHVTAVPVVARAVSPLALPACDKGHALEVAFGWHGAPTRQPYYSDCSRGFASGDRLRVFAASDDPSNLGPTADWILRPDEHDPFDVIGPNGLRGFMIGSGVTLLLVGAAVLAGAFRSGRCRSR